MLRSLIALLRQLGDLGQERPLVTVVSGVIERIRAEPLGADAGNPGAPAAVSWPPRPSTLVSAPGDAACQASGDASVPRSRIVVSAPRAASDERVLVERSQAGDRAAFEELVRRYADRLYAVVLRFVADAAEAEEVTQEAFLRAWRSISRFEGRAQFFTIGAPFATRGGQETARFLDHGRADTIRMY